MKRCTRCGIEKPEETFQMQPSRGCRYAKCRECRTIEQREWRAKRKQNPPRKPETKTCKRCTMTKSISEFSPATPGYFHACCKACEVDIHREKRREQYRNDPTGHFYRAFINEDGIEVKRCSFCHAEKPISEFYINHDWVKGSRTSRFDGRCKECRKAIKKLIYANNPERYRAISRDWAHRHPDEHRAKYQRWNATNKEHLAQYRRKRRATHRERLLAYSRIYHSKETPEFRRRQYERSRDYRQEYSRINSDRMHATSRLWRQTFPEKLAEKESRRRARKRNAPRIEKIDRPAIIERDKWMCYLCGCICTSENVTLDHVIPLARGGSHTADNLRVACHSCNCRKGVRPPHDFLA